MAKSELIKEAIADAKSLQDLALQNAKNALEEAFTPQLKSMLSTKLQQEMEGDDEEAEDMLDNEAEDGLENDFDDEDSDLDEDESLEDLDSEMDDEDDDLDMDMDSEEDDIEESMDDMDFDDEDDEAEAAMEGEEDLDFGGEDEMEDDEDLELESILKELDEMANAEDEDLSESDEYEDEDELEEVAELKSENARLTTELEEAVRVISIQKNAMNETKLLNAKLLFTNKLFKEISMTEGQKLKVIEGFDKAETIKEAKLVFETTQNALANSKAPKKRVSESSKTIPGKTGAKKRLNLNEASAVKFKNRMQVLANLRKENILKNN